MVSLARQLKESLDPPKPKPKRRRIPQGPPVQGPGRPDRYKDTSGAVVPSVTTITGRFKDAGGLIRWAWKEGSEGRGLDEAKEAAGSVGHMCHQWIQDHLHGQSLTEFAFADPEELAKAKRGFEAFVNWAESVSFRILETETPLVSGKYGFGGTFDAIALVSDELVIADWKTGNRTYPEHLVQLAAYRRLLRERDGNRAPRSGLVIRLDKDTAEPHAKSYPAEALDLGWKWFTRARELYELDKDVGKIVRGGR